MSDQVLLTDRRSSSSASAPIACTGRGSQLPRADANTVAGAPEVNGRVAPLRA